jgi:hypothetical protein
MIKKKIDSNNKFIFVINNPKETHLWLFSKKFSNIYSSSVRYIQFTERKNLIDLSYLDDHSFYFWSIFSFSHFCFNFLLKPHKIKFFLDSHPIPSHFLTIKFTIFYIQSIHFQNLTNSSLGYQYTTYSFLFIMWCSITIVSRCI